MTYKHAEALTQNTVHNTGHVLLSTEKILENYKWLIEKNHQNYDSIMNITQIIIRNNPEILGCGIAFEPDFFPNMGRYFSPYTYRVKDSLISLNLGSADYEYSVMDWYQIPATIGEPYWSEPYFDTGGAEAIVTTYSTPFYQTKEKGKTLIGVITVDLSLEWLTNIVSSVHILETGYAAVISRNGTFVTHPQKELIMNQTIFSYAAELGNTKLREIGRDMQTGNTNFVSIAIKGEERMIYYSPLPSSKWTLAVVFTKSEMYAPLRRITIALIFLVMLGLFLLTFFVTRIITKQIAPLGLFAISAREVANGNFNTVLPEISTKDEMKDLQDSFVQMQNDLKKYIENLKITTSAKEKIESELRIAREIQMGMIPKIFPPFPDLDEIDLYAMLQPAREVGGDLYDFFLIDDKHLCFAIGDVSGKGVPASLFMAVTRTLLRSVAPKEYSTGAIVNSLNKSLSLGNESSMFVTFFIGIINLDTGNLKYTNAGHNPPVIIHLEKGLEMFEITKDIPIGLFENINYTEKERTLSKMDCLFLYTDGVTEAENCKEELYSEKKMIDCISSLEGIDPKKIIQVVANDVAGHVKENQQSDDITMLSIIYYGK